jgi:peptidoglycan/xylan/chitin deacetylase (PgdA/CDA1 family)
MMKSLGLRAVQWDVVTDDPEQHVSAADIVKIVKEEAVGGSIIIMHANGRGWHTAEALPAMIDYLRAAGYELVTVDELSDSDKQ